MDGIIGDEFLKVLVLDKDIYTLHMVQVALGAQGFSTMSTTSEHIHKHIDSFQPNLLILEYDPSIQIFGTSIFQQVRSNTNTSRIPIVLMSWNEGVHEYANINSADAWIMKPLDYIDLSNTVKDALSI